MSEDNQEGNIQPSCRKFKKLYNRIRKQMEYYFSDSNLVKDKFLVDLISEDPDGFVNIDVFKKFNKIKSLTNSSEVIAISVSRSDLFEISADRKRIKRVAPLELSKDFDACTLYVEKLPPNADQKWVKDVLGHFGPITHVNVPRFKITNKIKGFAFVEFESPEGVTKACEFYKSLPEKQCSTNDDESKNVKHAKKHKVEEAVSDKKSKKSRTRSVSESSDKVSDNCANEINIDGPKTKRRKKKKNSKKHRSNTEKPVLRVMPKSEWKNYRNKYLDLQRSITSSLKKQILQEMRELKEQESQAKPVDASEPKKSLQFMPGIIIKIKLTEPVKNPAEIKTQAKANAVVAYVDAPVESSEIFIRCHSSEDAQTIIKDKKLCHLGKAQLIEGDEEKKYWEKIEADRKNKFNNPVIHKKRGRDKLIAKATKLEEARNKHIYFIE